MDAQELKLDGNAAAGTLEQIFAFEVTSAVGTCAYCGAAGPVGAASVYGPPIGIVVRCPKCTNVLLRLASDGEGRYWLEMSGCRSVELRT